MSVDYDTAKPYIAAFVVLRDGNKVAFIRRQNTGYMDDYYGLPSGKVEWHEKFSDAAIREAKEEVGVTILPTDLTYALTVHRHSQDTEWVDTYFEAINWTGEVINAEPDKCSELCWLDSRNLPDNVVPSVAAALLSITQGLKYAEYGWDAEGQG